MTPVTGCHSVMESPEPVSRVSPPTTTISPISPAIANSHSPTPLSARAAVALKARVWAAVYAMRFHSVPTLRRPWRSGRVPVSLAHFVDRRSAGYATVTPSTKKLIGTIFIIVWLPFYALVAMRIGVAILPDAGGLASLLYYANPD